jgi:type II secretory pathway component PulJ
MGCAGATLAELMVSITIAITVLGVLTYASIGLTRSISGTDQYMTGVANTNRILDAISQDLRRAVRVGLRNGSTTTPLKANTTSNFTVSDTNILSISVPDYYANNTPDNSAGSTYKTTRYPRATLNTSSTYNSYGNALLNGTIPWTDAQTMVGNTRVARFAPSGAGNGEIEVRYYRGARSVSDPTVCILRSEYASGSTTPSSTREIAARITDSTSTTTCAITVLPNNQSFRLSSSFTPRFRLKGSSPSSSNAVVEVKTRNIRRD